MFFSHLFQVVDDSMERCIPSAEPVILEDATNKIFRNEAVRFLPAISETFQCHSDMENIVEGCPETRNDESSSELIDIIGSGKYTLTKYTHTRLLS